MTSTAHPQRIQTLEAISDEVLARQRRFHDFVYGGGPTPLESLRIILRRKRRRFWLHRLVLGTAARQRAYPADALATGAPFPLPLGAGWGHAVFQVGWRATALVLALGLPLHLLLPSATEAMARAIFARVPNAAVEEIDRARACVEARPILDSDDTLVGVAPVRACASEHNFLSAPVSAEAAAAMHLAWRAVEGEYRVAPSTISGLNIKGWSRAILQQVRLLGGSSGGSSPIETGVKNLRQRSGRLQELSKLRSGFDTLTYTAHRLPEGDRDRFVSEAVPCVVGVKGSAFGQQLAGDLCPRFKFSKGADELDWAERCLWAGSAQPLYWVLGTNSTADQIELARSAQVRIRARARDCVERIGAELGWQAQDVSAWQARVDTIVFPAQRRAQNAAAESVDLNVTIPGLVYVLRDELKLEGGSQPTAPVQLHVGAQEQRWAYAKVMEAARGVENRLSSLLCIADCGGAGVLADVVVALAEIDGDRLAIRQVVANRHFLLTGPIERVDDSYRRAPSHRGVGSTSKAWLLPRLVAEGHRELCNRVSVGTYKPAQAGCADGAGMIGLREAIARSVNPAFADAVRKLGVEPSKAYFRQLGFDFDAAMAGRELVDGLVLGHRVTAAPLVLMRNVAALYRGYLGEEPVSSLPSLIAGAELQARFDWRDAGVSVANLRASGDLLTAPIREPKGTLHSLGPVVARQGCSGVIGKTGTSDSTVPNAERDRIVLAAFQCGSRRYVAYAMIGSPSVHIPLGNIRAAEVVQLIEALLSAQMGIDERS